MTKMLIIPDVHLKWWMFDAADKAMKAHGASRAVQMGDLVDDWGQEANVQLYRDTMRRAIRFQREHPTTLWVLGNHDFGYYHPDMGVRETGHSVYAEEDMAELIREMENAGIRQRVMHVRDNCVFTHAGLVDDWVTKMQVDAGVENEPITTERLRSLVNFASPRDLWSEDSPIWARPQIKPYRLFGRDEGVLNVVGHTPVIQPIERNGLLSTDTFSTDGHGNFLGVTRFVVLDTETKEWSLTEEYRDGDE